MGEASMRNTLNPLRNKFQRFNWGLTVLALPGFTLLVGFYFVPLFGLILPFKNINYQKGIWGSDWVGMKNFEFFFASQDAWRVTRNTVLLNFLFIMITLVVSIALALLLYELTRHYVKLYQTLLFMPYFISWVAASYILYALINPSLGVLPNLLEKMGVTPPNFYFEPELWPVILTFSYLWKNVGYMTLLYYTALLGIDPTYYEAAAIDGASRPQQVFHISIPTLMHIIILLTLLQIGKILSSDFGMFYFMTRNSGALYRTTDVIDTYVFRALRVTGDIGMASAVGLYQSVIGFILVIVSNMAVKRIDKDYSIF